MNKYVCTYPGCTAALAKNSLLVTHTRTHTGDKPHICEGCSAAFADIRNLKRHRLTHDVQRAPAIKSFVCDFPGCSVACTRRDSLIIHKRIHTGDRPHVCDYKGCSATFVRIGDLQTHIRTHTGQRPFCCTYTGCSATFAQSCALAVHTRTHTGFRPHKCTHPGCCAAFHTSGDLMKHERIHTGTKPFSCSHPGCGASFSQRVNLTKHARMHTPEGQARQKKQEHRVALVLEKAGIDYKREHHIDFRCVGDIDGSFARVDFLIIAHGKVVFLEVDETQHKFGYGNVSCDMKRMSKITESLAVEGNSMPIVMLRYNPDGFSVDGKAVKKLKTVREAELMALLKDPESSVFSCDQPLVIQYMYYDESDGVPTVTLDPDYNENIAQCVKS